MGTGCLLGLEGFKHPSAQEASSHSIPYLNVLAVVLGWFFVVVLSTWHKLGSSRKTEPS